MTNDGFTTCLWFDGQAEEAANYYASIFESSKIGKVSHYTEAGPRPAGSVLTVEFELNGQKFVALNGGPEFTFNEAISFQVFCEDQDEVDYYWNKLSEGGEEGPVRLAQGQVRRVLAGDPEGAHRDAHRRRPGEGEADDRGDVRDDEARHRGARASARGRSRRRTLTSFRLPTRGGYHPPLAALVLPLAVSGVVLVEGSKRPACAGGAGRAARPRSGGRAYFDRSDRGCAGDREVPGALRPSRVERHARRPL